MSVRTLHNKAAGWLALGLCLGFGLSTTLNTQAQDAEANLAAAHQMLADQLTDLARVRATDPNREANRAAQQAMLLLKRAVEVSPDYADGHRLLAVAAQALNDADTEREALRNLVRIDPGHLVGQARYVQLLAARAQTVDGQLGILDRAIEKMDFHPTIKSELALAMARLYNARGQTPEAITYLRRALQLNDTNVNAGRELFRLQSTQNMPETEQLPLLLGLLKANPFQPEVVLTIGQILSRQMMHSQAANWYGSAIEQSQASGQAPTMGMFIDFAYLMATADRKSELDTLLKDFNRRVDVPLEIMLLELALANPGGRIEANLQELPARVSRKLDQNIAAAGDQKTAAMVESTMAELLFGASRSDRLSRQLGVLEQTVAGKTGDFEAYPAAEAFIPPEHYVQRWVFSGQVPPEWKTAQWQWDFGDAQTATGATTQHVFLTDGVYPVKLTIKTPQKTVSITQRIWVRPRLYEQFPKPEEDRSSVLLAELSHYNPLLLSTNAAYRGMLAYKSADNLKEYQRWMEAWLTACVPTETPQLMNELRDYAQTMTQAGAAEALVGSLKLLHAKKLSSLVRAQAALLEVTALTEELSQPQVAQAVLDQCKPQLDPDRADAMHHFQVAQALTYIAAGKGKQCLETIKELGPRKNLPYNEMQMRQGVLARNIESFIAEGEFEPAQRALEQWEMDVPDTIPEGFSRVLKVKLYMAQKRYQTAIVIALQHAKALPDAYYAAELLWRAAEAQIKSSNLNEAKALQQLIREKYPESPWARQATTLPQAN